MLCDFNCRKQTEFPRVIKTKIYELARIWQRELAWRDPHKGRRSSIEESRISAQCVLVYVSEQEIELNCNMSWVHELFEILATKELIFLSIS